MCAALNDAVRSDQFSHKMFLDQAGGDAMATALAMVQVSFMLAIFASIGWSIGNFRSLHDTGLLGMFVLFMHRDTIYQVVLQSIPTEAYIYVVGTCLFQIGTATIASSSSTSPRCSTSYAKLDFLRPMIFPCRTTHTRLFPSKHSFSYSYLFVGVPIGRQTTSGALLSTSEGPVRTGWFSVHADDYLARGRHTDGLFGKLKDYLSSQNVPTQRYPYAYLVTAPRFLGFSFNPVSFWYLYDESKVLSAMILEVNNTFDERRMYLMERSIDTSTTCDKEFQSAWSKDFHVSPFNDRDGSYSLKAKDLLTENQTIVVDNNIVLRDDCGKAKLVARVFSTRNGIDPSAMSRTETLAFVARWWWVGFMTNPRILREARILWVKRLQVYYRPEVYKTSIGRNESTEEPYLESYFRSFLVDLVNATREPTTILYTAAAGPQRGRVIRLNNDQKRKDPPTSQSLALCILTPAFYGEFVCSQSIEKAFAKCCFTDKGSERMLDISNEELFRSLLQNFTSRHICDKPSDRRSVLLETTISALRVGITRTLFKDCMGRIVGRQQGGYQMSEFDNLVRLSHPSAAYQAYLRILRNRLLIDKIAFGFGWLLDFYTLVLRITCLLYISHELFRLRLHSSSVYSLLALCLVFHTATASLYRRQPENPNQRIATVSY